MPTHIVLKAGHIIHPDKKIIENNRFILITDGLIQEITQDEKIIEKANQVIDLSDKWVLPGLFDCHTHFCNPGLRFGLLKGLPMPQMIEDYYLGLICYRDGYATLRGASHAADYLRCGFTSARDLGNAPRFTEVDLKRAVMENLVPGPHIQIMGQKIEVTGGQTVCYGTSQRHQPTDPMLLQPDVLVADSVDEIIRAVRINLHYGADWIKMIADGQRHTYSVEHLKAGADEAHRAGVKITGHNYTRQGGVNMIEAGFDCIEHGQNLTDDDLKKMCDRNITLVITPMPAFAAAAVGSIPGVEFTAQREEFIRVCGRAYALGVTVVYGTDNNYDTDIFTYGEAGISKVETFAKAGMPPLEILRSMTTHAAELLSVSDKRGSLKIGYEADIIATDKNPMENIENLHSVSFVMKTGKQYR